jgi:hypothetical protein
VLLGNQGEHQFVKEGHMLQQLDNAIGFTVVMLLLSMLITVAVQSVSAVLDLRGRNLVWGLTKLFHQMSPDFQQPAEKDWNELRSTVGKKLAEAVAKHPMLSHSLSGRAKALRADELLAVLHDLVQNPTKLSDRVKGVLQNWAHGDTQQAIQADAASALVGAVNATSSNVASGMQQAIEQKLAGIIRIEAGVAKWFDTVMGRTSDVFLRWTKAITITAAMILAFGFHVDSISIYHQISTDSELRAKLGGMADETAKNAGEVMNMSKASLAASLTKVKDNHADGSADALMAMPQDFRSCGQAETWLSSPINHVSELLSEEFLNVCRDQMLAQLDDTGTKIATLKTSIDDSGLHLTSADWNKGWSANYLKDGKFDILHFFGLLATAMLLNLGAPFWFNALRQLSSLKPATARKIEQEEKQCEPANPATTG